MYRAWLLLGVILSGCATMRGGRCPKPQAEIREIQRLSPTAALVYGSAAGVKSTVVHYGTNRNALDRARQADVKRGVVIAELWDLYPRVLWYVEFEMINECGSVFTNLRRIPEP